VKWGPLVWVPAADAAALSTSADRWARGRAGGGVVDDVEVLAVVRREEDERIVLGVGKARAAGVLAVAAGISLLPTKRARLRRLRVLVRSLGALRAGFESGGWCLGCCWALMASLVALGMKNLAWMVAIWALVVPRAGARDQRELDIAAGVEEARWFGRVRHRLGARDREPHRPLPVLDVDLVARRSSSRSWKTARGMPYQSR